MNQLAHKLHNRQLRQKRVRSRVTGTTARPRLSVHISNRNIIAQIIDDTRQKTLAASTTVNKKTATGTMTERAAWVGADIAKKALTAHVKQVAFDRNGRLYHGRVKVLADTARENGLSF